MNKSSYAKITVQTIVNAPLSKVWNFWNLPEHIIKWNAAIDSWHCPSAENDLRVGGKIKSRMEAKDGSMGFDFEGVYTEVIIQKQLSYQMADGREVSISFKEAGEKTEVIQTFDAEETNPAEIQRQGWQAILNNFQKYVEMN